MILEADAGTPLNKILLAGGEGVSGPPSKHRGVDIEYIAPASQFRDSWLSPSRSAGLPSSACLI